MAMYIIARDSIYGENEIPDFNAMGELTENEIEMYTAIYRAEMSTALAELGYEWFEGTSEIGFEAEDTPTLPLTNGELKSFFSDKRNEVYESLCSMDSDELCRRYAEV